MGHPLPWPITGLHQPLGILRLFSTATTWPSLIPPRYSAASPASYPGAPAYRSAAGERHCPRHPHLAQPASRRNYPAIPAISTTSGDTYNAELQRSVWAFQRIFNLTPDGQCSGPATWNKDRLYLCSGHAPGGAGRRGYSPPGRASQQHPAPGQQRRNAAPRAVFALLRVIALYDDEVLPPIAVGSVARRGVPPKTPCAPSKRRRALPWMASLAPPPGMPCT